MDYMNIAYQLAEKALYKAYPNPMVGAVIVKNDKIIGSGYHEMYGENHAEKNAVEDAYTKGNGKLIEGSTMYVTLEPCNHYGKTPPCVDLIIKEKIAELHISLLDVNPLMQGKSVEILERSGIRVSVGYMADYGRELNSKFISQFKRDYPYITLKTATTLDGKIASKDYDSKWITSEESRKRVHEIRANNDAILTTYKTANIDNARLNIRHIKACKNPVPIIIDADLKTDRELKLFDLHKNVLIITSKANKDNKAKIKFANSMGKAEVNYIYVNYKKNLKSLDLLEAFRQLKKQNICSILVEAGGKLNWELVEEKLIDEYYAFIAPKLLGGINSILPVSGQGFDKISDCLKLDFKSVEMIGDDILIRGKVLCSQV